MTQVVAGVYKAGGGAADALIPLAVNADGSLITDMGTKGTFTAITANGSAKGAAGTPGVLLGITCIGGTSPSCKIYNNGSAAGTVVFPAKVMAIGDHVSFGNGIDCPAGIFAEVGGTTPAFNVIWK